jgi:hypothetical protein
MDKINLTESQLHRIIKESVKTILVEIGYRTATLAAGANMKANNDIRNGIIYYGKRKRNNMDKVDKSAKLDYKAISPEKEGYLTSLVKFHFNEIIYLSKNCFIMQGVTEMSKHPIPSSKYRPKPVYVKIQYDFNTQQFTEVVYCANGTIRRKDILTLITAEDVGAENKATADSLLLHMSNCLYSIEDYQSSL